MFGEKSCGAANKSWFVTKITFYTDMNEDWTHRWRPF